MQSRWTLFAICWSISSLWKQEDRYSQTPGQEKAHLPKARAAPSPGSIHRAVIEIQRGAGLRLVSSGEQVFSRAQAGQSAVTHWWGAAAVHQVAVHHNRLTMSLADPENGVYHPSISSRHPTGHLQPFWRHPLPATDIYRLIPVAEKPAHKNISPRWNTERSFHVRQMIHRRFRQ